jgi:predicted nucleotidyltransferase
VKKEILERELKKIASISKEFGAKKVILFGSCLEDIESARDIDITVNNSEFRVNRSQNTEL